LCRHGWREKIYSLSAYTSLKRDCGSWMAAFGTVWNAGGATPALNTLLSTGVGLRWQVRESLLLEVNYGIPLSRTERGVESSWQDQGINFRFQLGTSF
jgi:hemolysin activation/secretion protein